MRSIRTLAKACCIAWTVALCAAAGAANLGAEKKTVCTITVNSADEKEVFRQRLPADKYQFVELLERGRPDWLASACQTGVQCDVLVISGHFAGTNFFSEQVEAQEFLPVDEMERVSCSDSCPGLFSRLKEVYLFGCNTLNAEGGEINALPIAATAAGRPRDVLKLAAAEAGRNSERLIKGSESSRERMRRIFSKVPVLYGFSSKAPVGETAAGVLNRYFRNTGGRDVATGRVSPALLAAFKGTSLTAASGLRDGDPQANHRDQVCRFFDERLQPAQKLDFIHQVLRSNEADVRRFFDRIEKFTAAATDRDRQTPAFAKELDEITADRVARERYLALQRMERPPVRARMIKVAGALGWLTPDAQLDETVAVVRDVLARPRIDAADVDFVCSLNDAHDLDEDIHRFALTTAQAANAAHHAALACLGSPDSRRRVLQALTSSDPDDVNVAQVYFRHRPIEDPRELRAVATAVARMEGSASKVAALDTLARHYITDRESLEELALVFSLSESLSVQRAIAGILIRSDYRSIARPDLARSLAAHRLRSPDGEDVIDVLIRRLLS